MLQCHTRKKENMTIEGGNVSDGWITNAVRKSDFLGKLSRRGFFGGLGMAGSGVSLSSMLAACSLDAQKQGSGIGSPPNSHRLKAAFTNAGLTCSWCAQGKQVAEAWG